MMQPDSSSLSSARDENSAVTSGVGQPPLTVATPGPWHRGSDELSSRELWNDVYAPNGFIVTRVTVDRGENNVERAECHAIARANADLIAAAPDLLAALREAENYLTSRVTGTRGEGETRVLPIVRAAIAKAEGRAQGRSA